jgi:hypothetical protein
MGRRIWLRARLIVEMKRDAILGCVYVNVVIEIIGNYPAKAKSSATWRKTGRR